jgi:SAM-dependent methyltransferase
MNEDPLTNYQVGDYSNPQSPGPAEKLYSWLYQAIRPALKGKVLEIGSGDGHMAAFLVSDEFALRLSDPENENCRLLKKRFEMEPAIKGIHLLDPANPDFETAYPIFLGRFDTVVSIARPQQNVNVPVQINNMKQLLRDRGRLIVVLPARTTLFVEPAEDMYEWWRWNRGFIKGLLGPKNEILNSLFFTVGRTVYSTKPFDRSPRQLPDFHWSAESPTYSTGIYIMVIARIFIDTPQK